MPFFIEEIISKVLIIRILTIIDLIRSTGIPVEVTIKQKNPGGKTSGILRFTTMHEITKLILINIS